MVDVHNYAFIELYSDSDSPTSSFRELG